MSKIQLYIATTIDGYIAREDGGLDWLDSLPNPNNEDYGYYTFYDQIDTVVMGRKTYDEILGFDVDWPYANCKSYVVTSNTEYEVKTDNTYLVNDLNQESIAKMKAESNKNIWIVGGGELITTFLNLDAIDEMIICIIPTIIGNGIRLFPSEPRETKFELVNTESFDNGAVILNYKKVDKY
jgi:dihydrofolate reductase